MNSKHSDAHIPLPFYALSSTLPQVLELPALQVLLSCSGTDVILSGLIQP
jgi:hypothetical protein